MVLIRQSCILVWAKQGNVAGLQGEGRVLAEVVGQGTGRGRERERQGKTR